MKWDKYTIDTTTEAEDFISMMLSENGIEGIEIEAQTGRSFFEVVQSGNVDYAAVHGKPCGRSRPGGDGSRHSGHSSEKTSR